MVDEGVDVVSEIVHRAAVLFGLVTVEVGGGDGADAEVLVPGGAGVGTHVRLAWEGFSLSGGVVDGDDYQPVAELRMELVEGDVGIGAVDAPRSCVFLNEDVLCAAVAPLSAAAGSAAAGDGVLVGFDFVACRKKEKSGEA